MIACAVTGASIANQGGCQKVPIFHRPKPVGRISRNLPYEFSAENWRLLRDAWPVLQASSFSGMLTADVRNGSCLKNAYGPIEPIRVSSAPVRCCSADATRCTRPGRRCGRVGGGETRRSEMVGDARDRHVRPTLVGRRRGLLERGVRRERIGASWSRRRSAASRGRRTSGIPARRRRPAARSPSGRRAPRRVGRLRAALKRGRRWRRSPPRPLRGCRRTRARRRR